MYVLDLYNLLARSSDPGLPITCAAVLPRPGLGPASSLGPKPSSSFCASARLLVVFGGGGGGGGLRMRLVASCLELGKFDWLLLLLFAIGYSLAGYSL